MINYLVKTLTPLTEVSLCPSLIRKSITSL